MQVGGDYRAQGYAHVEGLIPAEVADAFLHRLGADLPNLTTRFLTNAPITRKVSIDLYAQDYPPMLQFLWGLTPAMRELTGADVLPSYNYFRLYRKGDICRVHSDREACEHSISLTLGYSDGLAWPFEIGRDAIEAPGAIEDDFAGAAYASLIMRPGDAVLYRGVAHRHGRLQPNPNRWSAHMFLHFVDRDGPHAAHAFDGIANDRTPRGEIDFNI
ncbi:MAG: hypothetical protein AB7T59_16255 [Hyphomonadaceae bacterium]